MRKDPLYRIIFLSTLFLLVVIIIGFAGMITPDSVVQALTTMMGVIVGSAIAGYYAVNTLNKQIEHNHKVEIQRSKDDEQKALEVLKSRLSKSLEIMDYIAEKKENYYFTQLEDSKEMNTHSLDKANDSLAYSEKFVDNNSFRFSVETLETIYEFLGVIKQNLNIAYEVSSSEKYFEGFPGKKRYEELINNYKLLQKKLFQI